MSKLVNSRSCPGFTLLELLVVIAIITLLVFVVPALSGASMAQAVQSRNCDSGGVALDVFQ